MFAWGLASCVPEPEPAPLGELCGVEMPTQVLKVGAMRVLSEPPLQLGEHTLYTTREPQGQEQQMPALKYGPPELHSVGACGASPQRLGALESPTLRERWPGVALACDREAGQIVAMDLQGGPLRGLYGDCGVAWSGHGRISVVTSGETGATVFLHPDPVSLDRGPAAPVALFGPVRAPQHDPRALQVLDDLIFVATPDDRVVSIDLRTREVTVEQEGVRQFQVSADGRYLLWQGLEITSGPDATVTRGPVVLNDRERDVGIGLGETGLGYSSNSMQWADRGLLVLTVGTYQQIYTLPELTVVDVPEGLVIDPLGPLDDHRWLVRGQWSLNTHVLDLTTGVTTPLLLESTVVLGRDSEVAWLIEMGPCCEAGTHAEEGPVWRVPLDGSAPRRVADRSSRHAARVGNQLVTVVDIGVDYLGALLRVDLVTGAEEIVDDHVFATSLQADAHTGVVRYSRLDAAGASVWQFALPG